jgi:glycylpeptide N-tetradecanoyltransferase
MEEVATFLTEYYVEDDVGHFRLNYTKEKLRWAMETPGYIPDLHFCVRSEKNNKIMAVIAGQPKKVNVLG